MGLKLCEKWLKQCLNVPSLPGTKLKKLDKELVSFTLQNKGDNFNSSGEAVLLNER